MTEVRLITTHRCPSLSGASRLEYAVGCAPSGSPHLQILKNDGGGFFSHEWIEWKRIHSVLKEIEPITSTPLGKLFTRRSANTPGFLLAVLVKEKLVEALPGKTRHFKLLDPQPFLDRVAKLAKSVKPAAKKSTAKKAPPKKKAK